MLPFVPGPNHAACLNEVHGHIKVCGAFPLTQAAAITGEETRRAVSTAGQTLLDVLRLMKSKQALILHTSTFPPL